MPVSVVQPMVKISRMYCSSATVDEIKAQLIKQNSWLNPLDFVIKEQWFTELPGQKKFATIIVETSIDMHTIMLKKGFIIYGLKKSSVNEHVKLLQCGRCWRYGHTGMNCRHDPICRKCNANHLTSQCPEGTMPKKICINCTESNKKGTEFNFNHAPNDDRCPKRMERINGLKSYYKGMIPQDQNQQE